MLAESSHSVGNRLLLVEDDRVLRDSIAPPIRRYGYQLTAVPSGLEAVRELEGAPFDLMLLDIELPMIDGWEVLQRLGGRRLPAVMMISARGDEKDKVRALDMGADDYLAKPFGTPELLSRMRAVLRRANPRFAPGNVVERCGIAVDFAQRIVWRNGEEVKLSPTEYLLLVALARSPGRVLEHRALLREVWGPEYIDEWTYLRTFAKRLRIKLEADRTSPEVIVSVPGRGYRFGPPEPLGEVGAASA
jgi:two-component system KDP operon response regulator KdpE